MSRSSSRSPRTRRGIIVPLIVAVVLVGVAAWLFLTNQQFSLSAIPNITREGWVWIGIGASGVLLSFLCAAAVLIGVSPIHLQWGATYMAQVAAAGSKVIAPAASGVVGLNVRFIMKHGLSLTHSVTIVAATQVAMLGQTAILTAILLPIVGTRWDAFTVPDHIEWWVGGIAVFAIVAVLLYARRPVQDEDPDKPSRVRQFMAALRGVMTVLKSPWRMLLTFGGSTALTMSLAVCMWASVRAVGGDTPFLTAAVVMMVGAMLGSLFPTPGGIGGVEGSMVAVFAATGLGPTVALPAVLIFRLLSFWIPGPLGALAGVWLRAKDRL